MLNNNEYSPFYQGYIDLASSFELIDGLDETLDTCIELYKSIPKKLHNHAYAEGKWTIKQMLAHNIDTERIFAYRALRIAREGATLSGFDENLYADKNPASHRDFEHLIDEFYTVRLSSISLFDSFTPEDLTQMGNASGKPLSTRACGYIITGHALHHNNILQERYLK